MKQRRRRWTTYSGRGKRVAARTHTARDKAAAAPRMLLQLIVCGVLFVALIGLKLLLPGNLSVLRGTLGQWLVRDADFVSAFSAVGRAASGEQDWGDSLSEAYVAVFGGESGAQEVSGNLIGMTVSEQELSRILYTYGEESFARSIARNIVRAREEKPIHTTLELAEIIKSSVPQKVRRMKNPCKKSFQAIRIAVNGEFEHLENGLKAAFSVLRPGGRLAVITFHSLEDRMVKRQFAQWCQGCICPPDFPQCVCGRTPEAKLVSRKPIAPSAEELAQNSRSRSAKLRVLERSR